MDLPVKDETVESSDYRVGTRVQVWCSDTSDYHIGLIKANLGGELYQIEWKEWNFESHYYCDSVLELKMESRITEDEKENSRRGWYIKQENDTEDTEDLMDIEALEASWQKHLDYEISPIHEVPVFIGPKEEDNLIEMPYLYRRSKSPVIDAFVYCALREWKVRIVSRKPVVKFKIENFKVLIKYISELCSDKYSLSLDNRRKALTRWFPDIPPTSSAQLDKKFIVKTRNVVNEIRLKEVIERIEKMITLGSGV